MASFFIEVGESGWVSPTSGLPSFHIIPLLAWTVQQQQYFYLFVSLDLQCVISKVLPHAGTKDVVLGEHDELWREIRHMHIAQASATVNERIEDFRKRNEAARRGGVSEHLGNWGKRTMVQETMGFYGYKGGR